MNGTFEQIALVSAIVFILAGTAAVLIWAMLTWSEGDDDE